jgi:hypothetical protein
VRNRVSFFSSKESNHVIFKILILRHLRLVKPKILYFVNYYYIISFPTKTPRESYLEVLFNGSLWLRLLNVLEENLFVHCLGGPHIIISFFQYSLTFTITSLTFYYSSNKKKKSLRTKFFIFLYQTFLHFYYFFFKKKKNILTFFTSATVRNQNQTESVYQTKPL